MTDRRKIGGVWLTVLDEKAGKYELTFYSKTEKNTKRRRFLACSKSLAIEAARRQDRARLIEADFVDPKTRAIKIPEALKMAIEAARANPHTKKNYKKEADSFLEWFSSRWPGHKLWVNLKPMHINEYLKELSGRGLAHDTMRLKLVPLKMAARFMYLNYSIPEPTRGATLPETDPKPAAAVMGPESLTQFLNYIMAKAPADVASIVFLQSLAGLRIYEAAFLREQDIDLEAQTVTITNTGLHRPKTRSSWRTIPIPPAAVEIIREALRARKIQGPSSIAFPSPRNATRPREVGSLPKKITRLLNLAHRDGVSIPAGFFPRRLRATFATLAVRAGVKEIYLQKFMGHSPASILRRHYAEITVEDLRREVLEPLTAYLAKTEKTGVNYADS